jgi:hypothetical protein
MSYAYYMAFHIIEEISLWSILGILDSLLLSVIWHVFADIILTLLIHWDSL